LEVRLRVEGFFELAGHQWIGEVRSLYNDVKKWTMSINCTVKFELRDASDC